MEPRLLARYLSPEGAEAYARKYSRRLLRRLSSRRELSLVERALARAVGPARRSDAADGILDCPCGAGRLLPVLLRGAGPVTAADASPAMIRVARRSAAGALDRVRFVAVSAGRLPFTAGSFELAVCHRLSHHLGFPERAAVLAELARVTRRAVVMSFADANTGRGRRRRRAGGTRRRSLLTEEQFAAEARVHGLELEQPVLRLFGWTSVIAVAVLRVRGSGPG